MSKPVKILWPVPTTTGICLAQPDNGGPLIINGQYAVPTNLDDSYAQLPGIQRTISISSTSDLHLITFGITGLDVLGNPLSVTKAGPNNGTVYTISEFSRIDSVIPDLPFAGNVSVGIGLTGHTAWFLSDYNRSFNALTISTFVTDNITYTFETTFDDPAKVADPFVEEPIDGVTIPTVPAATPMIDATEGILTNYTFPAFASRISITGSDANGSMTIYFLQQGTL